MNFLISFVGVPVPMKLLSDRDFRIDIDEVATQITPKTKLMIINSPNNPCGIIIEHSDMEELARLAKENDILVLSDEIYSRLLYEGQHHSIAAFEDMLDRTIILDGFSKTYAMTGWRVGFGIMPVDLVEPISRLSTNSVSCTAAFTQMAVLEAMNGPQDDADHIVNEFKKRRDIIVNGLNNIKGIRCPMPKVAFYILLYKIFTTLYYCILLGRPPDGPLSRCHASVTPCLRNYGYAFNEGLVE